MNKLLSVFILSFCIPVFLFAQTHTVKGKVTDEEGVGVPNANVVQVGGTRKGTQTDKEGNFSLTTTSDAKVSISVSSVGYTTKVLEVSGDNVKVVLSKKENMQDEVVIVGYKSVKRSDMNAAVASLGAAQLKDIPVSSAAEALTGKLAGVQVVTSEGSPDAEINIRVRGGTSLTQSNSPIYLVDGVQTEDALKSIAPQDIESIDVIKDPSILSIYGARGANGVIVITTKTPKKKKISVTYNGFVGFRQLPKTLSVMGPVDYVKYQYERALMTSDTAGFFDTYDSVYRTFTALDSYKDSNAVDWQDEVFGRTAFNQTHNISVTGGNDKAQFTLGYTHNDEDAIMLNSSFKRDLINLKINHKFNKIIKAGVAARYTDQLVNGAGVSASKEGQGQNKLRNTIKYRPFIPSKLNIDDFDESVFDETGGNGLNIYNPVLLAYSEYKKKYTKIYNISGNIDIAFTKYLSFKTTFGLNNTNNESLEHYNKYTSVVRGDAGANGLPVAIYNYDEKISKNNSNVLTFNVSKFVKNKRFKKRNDLTILLGQETYSVLTKQTGRKFGNGAANLSPKEATEAARDGVYPGEYFANYPTYREQETKLASFFGKVDYTYNKKYFATFSVRSDGASVLAPGHRWNSFTAGSLTWQVSRENFFKNNISPRVINDLKFRFSYGGAGNAQIEPFLYLSAFSDRVINPQTNSLYTPNYSTGTGNGTTLVGLASPYLANGLLKWETTVTQNIGFDIALFNNRFQLSVDAYRNTTKDLLLLQNVPATIGYTTQIQNTGQTRNTGIDIQLSTTIFNKKNFSWSANFNIGFNKNKILKLGTFAPLQSSGWSINTSLEDFIVAENGPTGEMYGYVYDGFYTTGDFTYNASGARGSRYVLNTSTTAPKQTSVNFGKIQPGTLKFKDLDGDSVITLKDRTIIGHAQPKFTGGLNQQFTFLKNFDLSIFVNWVVGNDVYNANKIEFTSSYSNGTNLISEVNDRWRIADNNGNDLRDTLPSVYAAFNQGAKMWIPSTDASSYNLNSWAIEDGSFLRINNVSLGYTFSSKSLRKAKISKLRVYATVNNLAVITNYSGYDPEANTRNKSPLTPGIDYSAYPRSRSYLAGINLTF